MEKTESSALIWVGKGGRIDPAHLDSEQYIASLLREAEACGMIFPEEVQRFQLAVLDLLAKRCRMYQSGSSSIREERAQALLESTLFTIGVWCKSVEAGPEAAVRQLLEYGPERAFEEGRKAARSVLRRTKQLWLLVLNSRVETGNHSYNETLCEQGLGQFFRRYNVEYEAHEIPCDIDYQLCIPVEKLAGVEFIRRYLRHVLCENRVCAQFYPGAVNRLLRRYDKRCDDLLLNVFGVVLTAAVGCLLAGKEPRALVLEQLDLPVICSALGSAPAAVFCRAAQELSERLELSGAEAAYLHEALPRLTPDVEQALQIGAPERVFPVLGRGELLNPPEDSGASAGDCPESAL